ncbi:MAG: flagellar biosynthetic protein FliQ [Candidatus Melainabacteria bacterium RIFOXYA12_FULL_32_12]|nr:MAG: flagellar biosynthetic protein FliQ [Candidatus Melainabacteria bacterium GWF2_32_7]OGI22986.1 MAG: flagellar biosynthetic protein FliQ [Candidatus Melainabacteria bacterium RIFOXYA2_FULL_32_9]OGI31539.1 MAG: flagellar biosynthetic protein FliQ [Candidatus Melainabacteria bacterium RIFOXYA12_FULL_32_12]
MTQLEFITILQTTLTLSLMLSTPILLVCLVVGLIISIFQSVTQIQEATLTFVPKILAGILSIIFLAPWMLEVYINGINEIFAKMAHVVH